MSWQVAWAAGGGARALGGALARGGECCIWPCLLAQNSMLSMASFASSLNPPVPQWSRASTLEASLVPALTLAYFSSFLIFMGVRTKAYWRHRRAGLGSSLACGKAVREGIHSGASITAQAAPEMTLSWLAACMPLACHHIHKPSPLSAAQDVVAAPADGGARAHAVAQPHRCSAGAAAGPAAAARRHQLPEGRNAHCRRCFSGPVRPWSGADLATKSGAGRSYV